MDTEIIKINENSWRIEDSGVRFFLLTGEERALLVDSGRNIDNAREIAESLTTLPVMLVNTHADGDHVAGNGKFDAFYMHPDEEPNYRRGDRKGTILPICEGDVLDPGGRPLEVIHLPGHTPGSIALLDRKNRVLISGDPIQDGNLFMFGPGRDMPDYIASLERLEEKARLTEDFLQDQQTSPYTVEYVDFSYEVPVIRLKDMPKEEVHREGKGI